MTAAAEVPPPQPERDGGDDREGAHHGHDDHGYDIQDFTIYEDEIDMLAKAADLQSLAVFLSE